MAKKDVPVQVSRYMEEIGRKGGQAKVPKGVAALSPERRKEIAAKGVEARRRKMRGKGKKKKSAG